MQTKLLLIGIAIAMTALTLPLRAESRFTPESVKVDLPTGDRQFPDGPGSEAVSAYCLACHSAGMVLTQPALSREAWEAEVAKMRTMYKAPIPDDQVEAIVSYLAGLRTN